MGAKRIHLTYEIAEKSLLHYLQLCPDFHDVFSRSAGTDTTTEVVMVYEVPEA